MVKILIAFFIINPIVIWGQKSFSIENVREKKLPGKIIKSDVLLDPISIQFFDSLLFIQNYQSDYHFDILDLKNGQIISNFCKRGRGPGEIIFPMNFQIIPSKNELMAYDVNQKKVNFYNLEAVIENNPDYYLNAFRIDSAYAKKVLLLKDGSFLCPLIGDEDGYKYCLLDSTGSFSGFLTKLPEIGKEYPKIISSNLFNYWVGINEMRDKIVLAYDHWDRIDIIKDVVQNEEITTTGPKHRIPEFKASNVSLTLTANNILAYCSPCVGEKSFIVLYSGKLVYDKRSGAKTPRNYTKALQFDFEGNLLKVFELNPGAQYITVDWKKKIIYGVNKELEPTLFQYKF